MRLRPVRRDDAGLLFDWRNDPETRRFAFNSDELVWSDHLAWLDRCITDRDSTILVAEQDGVPSGQLRFDRQGEIAVIDIAIAPAARGRGVGTSLLRSAVSACPFPVRVLRGEVAPTNQASLAIFRKAGFTEVHRDDRAVRFERNVDAQL